MNNTKKLVFAALFAALTCITTMVIKIPTPTMGYVHPGDAMVLLCGILLGPGIGSVTAGIGSMFADLFSGYLSYAPATLIIKALTAAVAALFYRHFLRSRSSIPRIFVSGLLGEAVMVIGYYGFETVLAAIAGSSLSAAATAAAAGIIFNIVQGGFGIVVCLILVPILDHIVPQELLSRK